MYRTTFINERKMVEAFIKETHLRQLAVNGEMRRLFVWGAELMLSEDTEAGDNRKLDLIATDETGQVWLIEAKLGGNPELSPAIWTSQLLPYRAGLAVMHPDTINRRARRYLSATGQYGHLIAAEGYQHMLDAFLSLVRRQGKNLAVGRLLFNKTLSAIAGENIITAVLADRYDEAAWNARPSDGRSYAYILVEGDAANPTFRALMEGKSQEKEAGTDYAATARTWAELARPPERIKTSPGVIEEYLANPAAVYFQRSIEHLRGLGWNGGYDSNQKAIAINMPTRYGADIRIHLGWIDFDSKTPMTYRVGGALGLKFNIDFRLFKESPDPAIQNTGYRLARKLALTAHYTGRRKGLSLRDRDLDDAEKASWDWETQRWRNNSHRDYIGRPEEEEDFDAAWSFLREIIDPAAASARPRRLNRGKKSCTPDIPHFSLDDLLK